MKNFEIALKLTKRGCQIKVSSKYRYYYRYFQTLDGALSYAKNIAKSLKNAHPRCENINYYVEGEYQGNLIKSI